MSKMAPTIPVLGEGIYCENLVVIEGYSKDCYLVVQMVYNEIHCLRSIPDLNLSEL